MKILLVIAVACLAAPIASAQLYKYVDKDGKTVYSDQPPINIDTRQLNIQSGASTNAAATGAAPKTALERDKDLQKGRDELRDQAKKTEDAAKQAQAKEQACVQARAAYQTYVDGGRIHKYNDKGEREFLGDEEIEAERDRSKREMDEVCKKT
jgi:Domain of unknown function (DUF4124)